MKRSFFFPILLLLLLLPLLASCSEKQVYIVYFGEHDGEKEANLIEETHHSYLSFVKESDAEARHSLLYSYKHSINGFSALLTPEEASKLSKLEGVASVFRSRPRKYSLQTTRSWEFVGLLEEDGRAKKNTRGESDVIRKAKSGKDVIVGLLDSGIWPESKSFSDENMGPIPKSWKGICQTGPFFNSSHCNRKIIGARYYIKGWESYYGPLNSALNDYKSPRDFDGHGTHTSSIASGRRVPNVAALGGFARGTASGGAPLARIAMYKVCWPIPGQSKAWGNTCFDEDMLAAIDDAIADGVHVLSISIGSYEPENYTVDSLAIGSLHALKRNIVVACAAGNSGPGQSTLSNPAPWIITVGASSIDRTFVAPLVLGNGMKIAGQSVTPYKLDKMYPLVFAGEVAGHKVPQSLKGQCLPGSLSPEQTKGKIVLCLRGNGTRIGKGEEVKRAGGVGFVLGNSASNGAEISVDAHVLPATAVVADDAVKILAYINSTKKPMATISPARTELDSRPAPFMAAFTSRGPNIIDRDILKPDITAPGLNILAAWSEGDSVTKLKNDRRIVKYNFDSGTSMATPHVAAATALLRAIHPSWSSAAIRSAIMTTARMTNNIGEGITDAEGKPADPFQFGSGHFEPTKAADPGLVYDASYEDYLLYLCNINVTSLAPKFRCPKVAPKTTDLNHPSLSISKIRGSVTVRRTVTNVGGGKSLYFASVKPPMGFSVVVKPSILKFSKIGEKKMFTITVKPHKDAKSTVGNNGYGFGWYTWTDGVHMVRSPMAVSLS